MSKTCQVSGVQATSKAWCSQCPMVCLGSAGKRRSCRRCQDTHIHSLRCERRRRRSRNSRIALFMNDVFCHSLKGGCTGAAKTNAAKQMVPQHSQEEVRSVSGSDASYTGRKC